MLSAREIEARLLAQGTPPENWMVWKRHFERGAPKKLVRLARELELEDKRILDVGCGYGVHLLHFSRLSLGIDRLEERVAFARTLGLRAEVRDVETLGWNLGLGDFDLVWVCDFLPHVEDPVAFLASLPTVLAPKGRIVLSEWLWPESERTARLLARFLPDGMETLAGGGHRRRLTPQALAKLLDAAGLEVERAWTHSLDQAWLGGLLRPLVPPRTIVVRRRRAAPQEEPAPDALRRHVLEPHRPDPARRARDLERRGVPVASARKRAEPVQRAEPGRRTGPGKRPEPGKRAPSS